MKFFEKDLLKTNLKLRTELDTKNVEIAIKPFQQTQAQVDEVVDIMRSNMEKVLERDDNLNQLDNRADNLQLGASRFEQSAVGLKKKYWWKNIKVLFLKPLLI